MVYKGFILVFTLYFNFGISIVEVKIKIQTHFKSLISNNTRMWWLKSNSWQRQTFIKKIVVHLSHGIKIIYKKQLYQ